MTAWELYFLLMLDNIRGIILLSAFICLGVTIWFFVWWQTAKNDKEDDWCSDVYKEKAVANNNKAPRLLKQFTPVAIITFVLFAIYALTPNTKQMAAIMVVPAIVNNEKIQELPNEVMELLGMSIDKAKEILQPEVKNDSQ